MINCIKCEFIKIRRKMYWLYVICFMVANILISNVLATQVVENGTALEEISSTGELSYTLDVNNFYMYGLPFLIIIFLAMYFHLESENDGWKMIKISGESIGKALLSKVIVTVGFVLYIFLCQIVVMLGYAEINDISLIESWVVGDLGLSLLGTLLNSLIIFLLFYLIDSVVINIVLGIVGLVVNNLLVQAEVGKYICTTYYFRILMATRTEKIQMACICVVGIVILLGIIMLGKIKHDRLMRRQKVVENMVNDF